jgi:hypothetical protein
VSRNARFPGRWLSQLLLIGAFVAVLGRGLLPAGYMLGPEEGHLSVVLCGSGATAGIDLGGDDAPGGQPAGGDGACVFAAGVQIAPATEKPAVERPPERSPVSKPAPPPMAASIRALAAPPPPSHAPPLA